MRSSHPRSLIDHPSNGSKSQIFWSTPEPLSILLFFCVTGKHGHFIANYPFESRVDDDDKNKSKPYEKDKGYKRSDKP
jgi:hypothetical protein